MDIKEIAKLANVSKSTVSRAINDDPRIKESTKEKILKVIEEIGYQPNQVARSLKTKQTKIIGILSSDLENPFYFKVLKGIEKVIDKYNYNILVCNTNYEALKEKNTINLFSSKKVDGIIASFSKKDSDNIKLLQKTKIPFILIDILPGNNDVNAIYTFARNTAKRAANYLIEHGHKKILLIYGPENSSLDGCDYVQGYIDALTENRIIVDEDLIIKSNTTLNDGYRIGKKLLPKRKFTAVLTLDDLLAIGIYRAAGELKIKIPDNLSIFGNDDIEFSKYVKPPLTTTYQPKHELGIKAAETLIDILNKKDYDNYRRIEMKTKIIIRDSIKKIKQNNSRKNIFKIFTPE